MPIHDFLDSSKAHVADMRHRMLLHSSFGIYIVEQVFGAYFTNSSGIVVNTRDVAEQHVIEDLGHIPSVDRWMQGVQLMPWMGGPRSRRKTLWQKEQENEHESTST